MGIAERKAASHFEDTVYPQLKKEIDDAAHFEVPVEVDWNSLAMEGYEHLYAEAWPKVYFTPLVQALRAIAVDELGREVLRGSLKRIVIRNDKGHYSGSNMAHFQDGVLTLDHHPVTNVDSIPERQEAIQKALEAAPEEEVSDDSLAAFLSWKAHGVNAVINALWRISSRQRAGIPLRLPRMTLLMRSGRNVGGVLHDVLEDRHEGRMLLVYIPRESGMPYEDIVLLPANTVEAISVHDVAAFGALRNDAPPTPSLLELRRRLAALERELRARTETPLTVGLATPGPTSVKDLRALGFLAERAREVLLALAGDKVGRTALREKVQRVRLHGGERSHVSFADHTLELTAARNPVDWSTREELEQAVQSAL